MLMPLSLHKYFLRNLKLKMRQPKQQFSHVRKAESFAATNAQHRPGTLATDGQMCHCIYSVLPIVLKKHTNVVDTPKAR